MRHLGKISIALSAMLLLSCSSDSNKREQKIEAPAAAASDALTPVPQSRIVYEMRVFNLNEAKACEVNAQCDPEDPKKVLATGELTMEIMSNFSIKFISGHFSPLTLSSFKIDLTKILTQYSPDATAAAAMANSLSTDAEGRIITTSRIGDIVFDPPRPLLLGPIIQNPDDFAGLTRSYPNIRYFSAPEATGQSIAGTATLNVRVLNHRALYTPRHAAMGSTPFEVLSWETTLQNQGSDANTQNLQALLLDRIAFYWRARPVQIPRLVLETGLTGLLGGQSSGIIGILGAIKVRMILDAKEVINF